MVLLVFTLSVRQLRRGGRIGEFVSVYLNPEQKAVYIASDGGRVCRPLLVLELGETRETASVPVPVWSLD